MRPLLALFALFFPLAALAQPARPVRVTNFPEVQEVTGSVEVSNLPEPAGGACAPFQLVGFTTATFTGGQGVLGFTRACQAEFPGSRFCTSVEVTETTTIPAGLPPGEAWVRPMVDVVFVNSPVDVSGVVAPTCNGWVLSEVFTYGFSVDGAGRFRGQGQAECDDLRAVACCAGPR